jgi:hypothetical protein
MNRPQEVDVSVPNQPTIHPPLPIARTTVGWSDGVAVAVCKSIGQADGRSV